MSNALVPSNRHEVAPLPDRPPPVVVLIATGGTIAMTLDPATGAAVPALSGEELLSVVPGLSTLADLASLEVQDLFNIPSDHMDPPRWRQLADAVQRTLTRDEVVGVVITHGTDTLEETAWFLDLTLPASKPVVMTGAQRNASSPDFDGPRNLLQAVRVCLAPQASGRGVMVVLNGQINAAREVVKTHTSDVGTFQSGAAGLLGTVDEFEVRFTRTPQRRLHVPPTDSPLPRVDIVPMYAGADAGQLDAALALGARGIVVQALGYGNVNEALFDGIGRAIRADVRVVVASRSPTGAVRPVYGFPGGGRTLQDVGAIFAGDLGAPKARILLMLALQADLPPAQIQQLFDR